MSIVDNQKLLARTELVKVCGSSFLRWRQEPDPTPRFDWVDLLYDVSQQACFSTARWCNQHCEHKRVIEHSRIECCSFISATDESPGVVKQTSALKVRAKKLGTCHPRPRLSLPKKLDSSSAKEGVHQMELVHFGKRPDAK